MIAPGSQRRSEVHQPGAAPVVRARLGDAIAARRSLPIGAECRPDGVEFVVWAPARRKVELVLEGPSDSLSMASGGRGYFVLLTSRARPGARYWFLVDGEGPFPDPASRFQPDGPHGPSEVIDPGAYAWADAEWPGADLGGQVMYELHAGTFTREGTWAAAEPELPRLAALGVTLIELMPVADFAGSFGWGYDGVDLYAPSRLYGRPDDLRRFIDAAHALGLGVILDVVYNHLGPEGNHLRQFSPDYFTDRYQNEWGDAINFDGESSAGVREFFVSNAGYWIDEFHFDGLRLDATQQIFDSSPEHVLSAVAGRVREAARGRRTVIVAENEPQLAALARPPDREGYGLDALWNDDFHHSAHVALTGRCEAYYSDYRGTAQELVSTMKRGFLYQGQRSGWQRKRRGTPANGLPPAAFVHYLQNHDQVANSIDGKRIQQLTAPGLHRALTAVLLLGPQTPLLFQGEELGVQSPFLYFADHPAPLSALVREGRRKFLSQFPGLATPRGAARLQDPADRAAFESSKLDPRTGSAETLALHRDLLRLRRDDPVFAAQGRSGIDGAVLSDRAFAVRWFDARGDRLLIVNLGLRQRLDAAPEPLLAPPAGTAWQTLWSSEEPRYGGSGTPDLVDGEGVWTLLPHAAVALAPAPAPGTGDGGS
jgi:maltooligosyltrehalose trehalohydrolase